MELVYLVLIGFVAGIINTLAGGGSVLTLPMLIFLGLPPSMANGTNRVAILIQNIFGTAGFKSKGINTFPHSIYLGIAAFLGALIGAKIGVDIKGDLFNKILGGVVLLVVFFIIYKPKFQTEVLERLEGKSLIIGLIAFFFIGIYGGFIQAGTGFFIILALTQINHVSLVKTNAFKTVIVFIYTIAAILVFGLYNQIDWMYGLVLAAGNATGAWVASRWSVGKDDRVIRYFLVVAAVIIAVKLWFPELLSF